MGDRTDQLRGQIESLKASLRAVEAERDSCRATFAGLERLTSGGISVAGAGAVTAGLVPLAALRAAEARVEALEAALREIASLRVGPCNEPLCLECKPLRVARAVLAPSQQEEK